MATEGENTNLKAFEALVHKQYVFNSSKLNENAWHLLQLG